MYMPNVHACAQLTTENEQLKKKLRKIKQENVNLQRELNDLKDRLRMEAMMKDFVTTRNMETQTDPPKVMNTLVRPEKKKEDPAEQKVNQLLSMHNGLMKRYEKELKTNMQHIETITNLNLKLNEAEQKLRESQMKTRQLEMEKESVQRPPEPAPLPDDDRPVHQLLKEIKKERDRYRDERDKLRLELRGLDHTFFEEIEDMKFALNQSTRLNQEYEETLRKMCHQFNVSFPHPEKRISTK